MSAERDAYVAEAMAFHVDTQYLQLTGPVARSVYRQQQVTRIAPSDLVGRDGELAELRRFCTAGHGPAYVWWQAPAWSGKSALMAWFVLNPPPGVRVMSFFITARFKGHSDRVGFIEVMLIQLAELLGQPLPPFSEATAELYLRDMVSAAAAACAERDERLVLLVDGLDEDRGVMTGPDVYSIAALLPPETPAGLRVIVAGRPNPPIPDDVPAGHPLRDLRVVRPLSMSPEAAVIREDMLKEIGQLLQGSPVDQDLLGLVTAAGCGLSGRDLAELTGWPERQVRKHLRAVAGRSFTPERPPGKRTPPMRCTSWVTRNFTGPQSRNSASSGWKATANGCTAGPTGIAVRTGPWVHRSICCAATSSFCATPATCPGWSPAVPTEHGTTACSTSAAATLPL
jgi:hypothetical protein